MSAYRIKRKKSKRSSFSSSQGAAAAAASNNSNNSSNNNNNSSNSNNNTASNTNNHPAAPLPSIYDLANVDVTQLTPRERFSYRNQISAHLAGLYERLKQAKSAAAAASSSPSAAPAIDVTAASPRPSHCTQLFDPAPAKPSHSTAPPTPHAAPKAPTPKSHEPKSPTPEPTPKSKSQPESPAPDPEPPPPTASTPHPHQPGHSTGPLTPEGKARSAMNAFRHGLAASPASSMLFLPHEDPDEHERLRLGFNEQFVPMTPAEHELIRELTDALWLARRARDLQTQELALPYPQTDRLALYLRYETAHTRAHHAAIKTLLALQKDRRHRNQHHEEWNEPLAWGLADRIELQRQAQQHQSTAELDDLEPDELELLSALYPAVDTSFRNPLAATPNHPTDPAATATETASNHTEQEQQPAA